MVHADYVTNKVSLDSYQRIHNDANYTRNQMSAMAEASIRISVEKPSELDKRLFVCLPMIFLLLQMCRIMAISTGAVIPYNTAEYNKALIGLMPKNWINKPISNEMMMVM